jgi:hypothetical protein
MHLLFIPMIILLIVRLAQNVLDARVKEELVPDPQRHPKSHSEALAFRATKKVEEKAKKDISSLKVNQMTIKLMMTKLMK